MHPDDACRVALLQGLHIEAVNPIIESVIGAFKRAISPFEERCTVPIRLNV